MPDDPDADQSSSLEGIEERLQKILKGAFEGAPTPLKDVPTHYGEKRKTAATKDQPPRKRRQRKNRAA